jgi:hypothetical protein
VSKFAPVNTYPQKFQPILVEIDLKTLIKRMFLKSMKFLAAKNEEASHDVKNSKRRNEALLGYG